MTLSPIKICITTILMATLFGCDPALACSDSSKTSRSTSSVSVGIQTVNEAIKNSPSTVLAFHSSSCGTCKIQKPRLQALLLKEQNSQIKNIFLDFDSEKDLRKSLKVSYPSTVIVFKNGLEVARVTGETNESELQKLLNKGVL